MSTVNGVSIASAAVVGEIMEYLMSMFNGTYNVTVAYKTGDVETTTVIQVQASDRSQIDITSAETISQLTDYRIISVVKVA